MVDQPNNSPEQSTEDLSKIIIRADEIIKEYKFLTNPMEFNASVYNGLRIILEKLTNIEKKLEEKEVNDGTTG